MCRTDHFTSQWHPLQRPNIPGGSFFDTSQLSLVSPLQPHSKYSPGRSFSHEANPNLGWDSHTASQPLPRFPWQGTLPHLLFAESQVSACQRIAPEAALCPDVRAGRGLGARGFQQHRCWIPPAWQLQDCYLACRMLVIILLSC